MEHIEELKSLDGVLAASKQRDELTTLKLEIAEKRQQAYLRSWNIRLEEKNRELQIQEKVLAMRRKEKELYDKLEEQRLQFNELEKQSGYTGKPRAMAPSIREDKTKLKSKASSKRQTSVANINDVISHDSDAQKMTSEWVQHNSWVNSRQAKLDARSLPDVDKLQHRREELKSLQETQQSRHQE